MDLLRKARQIVVGWSHRDRLHVILMSVILTGAIAHQAALWHWYIEDAAITFAYAKHLAMGEGLVPFIGGERVEGYSNPAWTFFLAPFSWFVDLHDATRWIQVLLLVPTVLVAYLAGREALEGKSFGPVTSDVPLVAPAILAASAQFAVWTGSGLEMALMNLFMVMAIWRTLVELRQGGWPWSALWWLGVTLSRPEAILYAAVAGFVTMVAHFRRARGVMPTVRWLATFFVPFGLYHAWRYSYFAWELPNTYYAKLERRPDFPLFTWAGKSWKYTRDFAFELGWGFFLPVWALGAIGDRDWRWPVAVGLSAVSGLAIAVASPEQRVLLPVVVLVILGVFWVGLQRVEERPPRVLFAVGLLVAAALIGTSEALRQIWDYVPNTIPVFEALLSAPPYVLTLAAVSALVLSIGSRHEDARRLVAGLCLAAVVFALIAQWDWMKGYRWYAPAVVPGALLFGFGVDGLARVVQRTFSDETDRFTVPGGVTLVLVTLAAVPANVVHTVSIATKPQTKPLHVKQRVNYVNRVRDTLHVDGERWRDLDVDQGAHLFWSDFEMLDIAGLIDVPLAQHKFAKPFLREYLFEETRPHFQHVHGGWAGSSGIPRLSEFRRGYVEIPGYIANRKEFHIGNHIRRDLLLMPTWPPDDRETVHGGPTRYDNGIVWHGLRVPSEPVEGGAVYVEIGLSVDAVRPGNEHDVRLWLIAERGAFQHTWELAPAYDWLFPHEWKRGEIFQGRYTLALPDTLGQGDYDLLIVVVNPDGSIARPEAGPFEERPTFAKGEVRYADALKVMAPETHALARDTDLAKALAKAQIPDCDEAHHDWWRARRHSAHDRAWIDQTEDRVARALATCHAIASDGAPDRPQRIAELVRARELDHWAPAYRERASRLADELEAEGHEARDHQDWETAYRRFADAVAVDRSRAWARRYAEEARAYRLGIDPESEAERQLAREQRIEEQRARAAANAAPKNEPKVD